MLLGSTDDNANLLSLEDDGDKQSDVPDVQQQQAGPFIGSVFEICVTPTLCQIKRTVLSWLQVWILLIQRS